jgi:hypothetical protein
MTAFGVSLQGWGLLLDNRGGTAFEGVRPGRDARLIVVIDCEYEGCACVR